MPATEDKPTIAITLGDPRGIGPEVTAAALSDPSVSVAGRFVVIGPEGTDLDPGSLPAGTRFLSVGRWTSGESTAGALAAAAIEEEGYLRLGGVYGGGGAGQARGGCSGAAGTSGAGVLTDGRATDIQQSETLLAPPHALGSQ